MLTTKYISLDRLQFKLLREAKQAIKQEFGEDLALKDSNVLDALYEFALESRGEELFEIFNELTKDAQVQAPQVAKLGSQEASDTVRIGDVVDGKRCVSFYRGNPIFKAA